MKKQTGLKKIIAGGIILFCVLTQLHAQSAILQWAKSVGGANSDMAYSVATDTYGNVYTTGHFTGTADFDPGAATLNFTSAGDKDIFITKLDASGNLVWAEQFGGVLADEVYSIAIGASGNVFITGAFEDVVDFDPGPGVVNLTSAGVNDIYILKLDTAGNFVWAKNLGGASSDYALSLALDSYGNVYTSGFFKGTADFNPGAATFNLSTLNSSGDIFVSKLDSSGNFVWAKDIRGNSLSRIYSIASDISGNVYATGYFQGTTDFDPGTGISNLTSAGAQDIFILKLDAAGNFVWVRNIGGSLNEEGYFIKTDASGNVYSTGSFQSTLDFDPGPGIHNLFSTGNYDTFFLKLDTSGNFVWAKNIGGPGGNDAWSFAIDVSDNIYATGSFDSTVDFDPGPGIINLTATGAFDGYILKLDSSGNFKDVEHMGGTGSNQGASIAVDPFENIYTIGDYYGTIDFDPGPGTFDLTSQGNNDVYITKLSKGVFTETAENVLQNNIDVFPNPSNGQVNLLVDHSLDHASLLLINTTGQIIMGKSTISGKQFTLDLSDVANGIYFIEINDGGKISRIKVVKD